MIIAWVLALLINYVAREEKTIRGFLSMLMDGFGEGSLLFMAGIGSTTFNAVMWYLSSMLISMAILYPLIRKYPDNMTKIILPVAVILMLGYLYQNYGTLRSPTQWIGFTYKGNIRAISEISMGVIGYEIDVYKRQRKSSGAAPAASCPPLSSGACRCASPSTTTISTPCTRASP